MSRTCELRQGKKGVKLKRRYDVKRTLFELWNAPKNKILIMPGKDEKRRGNGYVQAAAYRYREYLVVVSSLQKHYKQNFFCQQHIMNNSDIICSSTQTVCHEN